MIVKPGVPLANRYEYHNSCNDRLAERKDDLEETGKIACSVQAGRFFQCRRKLLNVSLDQNHIIRGNSRPLF